MLKFFFDWWLVWFLHLFITCIKNIIKITNNFNFKLTIDYIKLIFWLNYKVSIFLNFIILKEAVFNLLFFISRLLAKLLLPMPLVIRKVRVQSSNLNLALQDRPSRNLSSSQAHLTLSQALLVLFVARLPPLQARLPQPNKRPSELVKKKKKKKKIILQLRCQAMTIKILKYVWIWISYLVSSNKQWTLNNIKLKRFLLIILLFLYLIKHVILLILFSFVAHY